MKKREPIVVQSYAGYRWDEHPKVFRVGEIEYSVSRVFGIAQEQTSDGQSIRRFRVMTTTGELFDLVLDVETATWYLEIEV